ncbi:MAG TPA: methylglyoxal synthase [Candidatus Sulfomarinibacteraceae bacterium]|nr:methylglyoxal synthase [Candidatus Sulfomarinibacteraceae bacterium]
MTKLKISRVKHIALVAHDNMKDELIDWVQHNRELLSRHRLYATGTTGRVLQEATELEITRLQSGPLGGDQQIGAKISEGEINFLIFFWDPLSPHPHDPDVKALQRMAVVWNIPLATNRASADYIITSPLMESDYERATPDYDTYKKRLPAKDTGPP